MKRRVSTIVATFFSLGVAASAAAHPGSVGAIRISTTRFAVASGLESQRSPTYPAPAAVSGTAAPMFSTRLVYPENFRPFLDESGAATPIRPGLALHVTVTWTTASAVTSRQVDEPLRGCGVFFRSANSVASIRCEGGCHAE
ncbi:MAG TPA: hypothetical protein VEL79_15765 [Vicinamibacterales bacterium]|nr:hypothetical protein [Vicinamibacterales bacterium]